MTVLNKERSAIFGLLIICLCVMAAMFSIWSFTPKEHGNDEFFLILGRFLKLITTLMGLAFIGFVYKKHNEFLNSTLQSYPLFILRGATLCFVFFGGAYLAAFFLMATWGFLINSEWFFSQVNWNVVVSWLVSTGIACIVLKFKLIPRN